MTVELSPRLKTVASFIEGVTLLCDVGSDHAYLPVYAIQQGLITSAIAGEVVKGPFESAQQTVQDYVLTDKISVRLGDGLDVVTSKDEVAAISICGMGGELIARILEQGRVNGTLTGKEKLVLQPNVAEHLLRQWLVNHQYEILEEVVVEDHHRLYEIIVAEKRKQSVPLTATQIKFGPKLIENPTELVIRKWERQLRKIEEILAQLKQSKELPIEKVETFNHQYLELKGLIDNANR